jgi:hypothetical protein
VSHLHLHGVKRFLIRHLQQAFLAASLAFSVKFAECRVS